MIQKRMIWTTTNYLKSVESVIALEDSDSRFPKDFDLFIVFDLELFLRVIHHVESNISDELLDEFTISGTATYLLGFGAITIFIFTNVFLCSSKF